MPIVVDLYKGVLGMDSHNSFMDITAYFKKASSNAEMIPWEWLENPLPKKAPKRPVGRPRKQPYAAPCLVATPHVNPPPSRQVQEEPIADALNPITSTAVTAVASPGKRGKYKNTYSIEQKKAILEMVTIHGVRPTAAMFNSPAYPADMAKDRLQFEVYTGRRSSRQLHSRSRPEDS